MCAYLVKDIEFEDLNGDTLHVSKDSRIFFLDPLVALVKDSENRDHFIRIDSQEYYIIN